jgi:ribosomal protein S18 acetylase RimI-like enzyme
MEFRLAKEKDSGQLKDVYEKIIKEMNEANIQIWDNIYPCQFIEEDVKSKRLYIMLNDEEIISSFALCNTNTGEDSINWQSTSGKALYLDRFAVNVKYSKKGIGSLMLVMAKKVAKDLGAEYLRLFVVDINKPAIKFYEKNGFAKAAGIYYEKFDDGFELCEFGYEIKL